MLVSLFFFLKISGSVTKVCSKEEKMRARKHFSDNGISIKKFALISLTVTCTGLEIL